MLAPEVNMVAQPAPNQNLLHKEAYADDRHLDVRYRTHQLYTVDPIDFGRWTLEQLWSDATWRRGERVLDVGCARGDLLRAMASQREGWGILVGCDRSPGMIAIGLQLVDGLPIQLYVGDAQALPMPDRAFDVVMARHMLYHVPDIDSAIAEAARVLQPGGRFLVTTNSAHTMPEYWEVRDRAGHRFPAMAPVENVNERFSLENGGAYLEPYFDQVEVHSLHGTLRFPSAGPFVDYFASTRALTMHPDHTDAEWQAVVDFVQAEAEGIIAREGRLDVTKVTGAIVAVKGS